MIWLCVSSDLRRVQVKEKTVEIYTITFSFINAEK